ncbi:isochorismate synthase DhbC [Chitinimonas prasina]|uniref:isochorismate synthase n=1 Tax=Chitinimonas prasina TaxID=1434937 RepID=A0ABQ5YB41_9NEIS|nr:isochorismate synthase [Chitinimonas prasina]GLR12171.1 isochorismate synthase DhbC [Chitinimonas prasina]
MQPSQHDSGLTTPKANDLLRLYPNGGSLFTSPRRTVLTLGRHATLAHGPADTLAQRAAQLLRQAQAEGLVQPILLGAVPFNAQAPAHLFIPESTVQGRGAGETALPTQAESKSLRDISSEALPHPDRYRDNVAQALSQIGEGGLDKVVLSRSIKVDANIAVPTLLQRLANRNPSGYTFAIDLPDADGERRTLVGASPELLLSRRGRQVVSHPLAGSIPRSSDPLEDARRAEQLFGSAKDRHEHQLVVDAVVAALGPYCNAVHVPSGPSLVSTPSMWHLATEIRGDLADGECSALELALALHPTPAVCGHPTAAARSFIETVEGFDRGFFTGLVGWCDASGDGEWAVTIRCAEVGEHTATLYAGAGIVAGSEPHLELAETSAKLRTMLSAMALESVLEGAA